MSGMQQRETSLHEGSEGLARVLDELCSSAGRYDRDSIARRPPERAEPDIYHPYAHAYFKKVAGHVFVVNPGPSYKPKNGVLWSKEDAQPIGGVEAICLTPGREEPSSMHTLSQSPGCGIDVVRAHVHQHGIGNLTKGQREALQSLEELHGPILQTPSGKVRVRAGSSPYITAQAA